MKQAQPPRGVRVVSQAEAVQGFDGSTKRSGCVAQAERILRLLEYRIGPRRPLRGAGRGENDRQRNGDSCHATKDTASERNAAVVHEVSAGAIAADRRSEIEPDHRQPA